MTARRVFIPPRRWVSRRYRGGDALLVPALLGGHTPQVRQVQTDMVEFLAAPADRPARQG